MTLPKYACGSEWRKWDLQIHTPFSVLNNGFGPDFADYAKQMLTLAKQKEIAVIGVTDYFCVEGYKNLRALMTDRKTFEALVGKEIADYASTLLFLPNIEFRGPVIPDADGKDSRVNYHVILSDHFTPDELEQQFLLDLRFTAEGNPGGNDEQWPLTIKNLELLGKRLKAQHAKFQPDGDLFVGMMNAVVDHNSVSTILEAKPSLFKDNYIFCLPANDDLSRYGWDGQGHLTRKILIQKSHILFSSNASTREFALGRKHPHVEDFVQEFKTLKPSLHTSDAHSYPELFEPRDARITWIKADPTFLGLRQVLNEPEDRVYIGDKPATLRRIEDNPTRITTRVEVRKVATSTTPQKWFHASVPLNPELITIIGNKGNGKSALADILGLLGNTPRYESFSFLHNERFRAPKDDLARNFEATLFWKDGSSEGPLTLDRNPEPESVEKIKYIPQNYLEEICNEIVLGKGSRFYSELQQVIFSHVPEGERLGYTSLDDLLDHRGKENTEAIELLVLDLKELNKEIVQTQDRLSQEHRKSIELQLSEKRRELQAHDQSKPTQKPKPQEDPSTQQQSKTIRERLAKKQQEIEALVKQIEQARRRDSELIKLRSLGEKLIVRLQNLERQVRKVLDDSKSDFVSLSLVEKDIVAFTLNIQPIQDRVAIFETERRQIAKQLDAGEKDSPEHKRAILSKEVEGLTSELSAPERDYQGYLEGLRRWEVKRASIVGNVDQGGSVSYLEKQLADLANLPRILKDLQSRRSAKVLEIFNEKQKLRSYYSFYYGAVQKFLKDHPIAKSENFKLTFNVSIVQGGFLDAFLKYIDQRKLGPFAGIGDGATSLRRFLDSTDFNSADATLQFTNSLITLMSEHEGKPIDVKDQLRQDVPLEDLYDFVFSVSYLQPIYNLQWDQKSLEQLSPGERGNLLLIFYLLVDRESVPLVIDQPEENLDNQTVYKILVPCIKDAKKRRQIVMVTHNPNIAVVCDAEQVIYSEIAKDKGNEVTYLSGSIEDPVMNRKIIDVLEGTRPAFDKRDSKYQP